ECFKMSADIIFAVDSSHSIRSDDYHRQLSFLKAIVDKFTIGQNQIQVGVVSFASSVRLDVKLNDFNNSRDLKIAIGNIKQLDSGTNTQDAIHFIHSFLYEPQNGGRPWAKKQMVVITDGLSSNLSATLLEASIARSKGIEVFSVLVGEGIDDFETRAIASDPKEHHVFRVEDYKALMSIQKSLSSAACQSKLLPICDATFIFVSPGCKSSSADVIFLMDSSSSIWKPDFNKQIKFLQQVISSFTIGKHATRVGVIAYSDAPITLVSLSDKQTHEYIHQALANAPYITGGTNTAFAIKHARKLFKSSGGARYDAAHVIIILSDGQSNNLKETIAEASHAHSDGVYIFSIGIGNKTEAEELMALASDPDDQFVFHVNDYEALSEIKELLAIKTCDDDCPALPTDAVFIYDTTALSRYHHDYVIKVITEITESKILNSENLRVGVMRETFNEPVSPLHDIELTNEWTQSDFKTQLDPDSRTASADLLFRKARHNYFHPTIHFDNISSKRTIILFLDSLLKNPNGAALEAMRLRRSHVNIVVVTLGKHTRRTEVERLASSPHDTHVIAIPSLEDYPVESVVSKLTDIFCVPETST
ncbi:unnamed protein product, partial [Candidula unifasciata]